MSGTTQGTMYEITSYPVITFSSSFKGFGYNSSSKVYDVTSLHSSGQITIPIITSNSIVEIYFRTKYGGSSTQITTGKSFSLTVNKAITIMNVS